MGENRLNKTLVKYIIQSEKSDWYFQTIVNWWEFSKHYKFFKSLILLYILLPCMHMIYVLCLWRKENDRILKQICILKWAAFGSLVAIL